MDVRVKVNLVDARSAARRRSALRRLFPLYVHELSPFTSFYALDSRGRWRPELWRDWLLMETMEPYLIESSGEIAGFAVVGHQPFPYMSPDRHHKLCEFFVLAPLRRRGIGRLAAESVLGMHEGGWELTVLPGNERAIAFWRSVLSMYTRGRIEEVQLPGDILFRFEVNGSDPR